MDSTLGANLPCVFWKSPFVTRDTSSNACFFHCHVSFFGGTVHLQSVWWHSLARLKKILAYETSCYVKGNCSDMQADSSTQNGWSVAFGAARQKISTYCERFFAQVSFHNKILFFQKSNDLRTAWFFFRTARHGYTWRTSHRKWKTWRMRWKLCWYQRYEPTTTNVQQVWILKPSTTGNIRKHLENILGRRRIPSYFSIHPAPASTPPSKGKAVPSPRFGISGS